MKVILLLVLISLICSSLAGVLFERNQIPSGWVKLNRANPSQIVKFRVALNQRNIQQLEDIVLDISDPESSNYGKWLSNTEVLDLIAPSNEVIEKVTNWLKENNVGKIDASGRDIIKAEAPISVIEEIFNTQMFRFVHVDSKKVMTRAFGTMTVPDEVIGHIDIITGIFELVPPSILKPRAKSIKTSKKNDVSAGYVIPEFLRTAYGYPTTFPINPKSSICVAEFQDDQSYNQDDLTFFNQQMLENVVVNKNVGPFSPSNPDGESTLDVQFAFSMALNTTSWFYTVDQWMLEFANDLFVTKNPPLVVSMSWGWPEPRQCEIVSCSNSKDYVTRTNSEFLKVTSLGVSLLAASGDQGAPGDTNPSCDTSGTLISNIFPGASPWVTSVGATMLDPNGKTTPITYNAPACQQFNCPTTTAEIVCTYPSALITSGGGFSDYVVRPLWQNVSVNAYLKSGVTLPPTGSFSPSNRAFPDVSALGHSYLIGISGSLEQVDGTSASCPVFAAAIALLNSERLNRSKKPLGFLNPLLYKMAAAVPAAFNDITSGNNYCTESCCGTYGFVATKGWDPVTGLGTPNFAQMLKYVKTLN